MLNVGGLVRGRDVKDVLVRKLNPTNTNKDPHSTATLSTQDLKDIASNLEVVQLKKQGDDLKQRLRATYGTITKAPSDTPLKI